MMLDKELYRQVFSWYRQWNEAETRARIEEARQLSSYHPHIQEHNR